MPDVGVVGVGSGSGVRAVSSLAMGDIGRVTCAPGAGTALGVGVGVGVGGAEVGCGARRVGWLSSGVTEGSLCVRARGEVLLTFDLPVPVTLSASRSSWMVGSLGRGPPRMLCGST